MSKPSVLLVALIGGSVGALVGHFGDGLIPGWKNMSAPERILGGMMFGAEFAVGARQRFAATPEVPAAPPAAPPPAAAQAAPAAVAVPG